MSKKWLLIWLVVILIFAGVVGYLFFSIRNAKEFDQIAQNASDIEILKQQAAVKLFDYTKDSITGTILGKTFDDDGYEALRLYVSWPPNAPVYDKNVIVPIDCSAEKSSLSVNESDPVLGINVYELVEVNDILRATCLNQYCSVVGGACELIKKST